MRVFREEDADAGLARARRIAIIGYGNQGHAHALNLRDSGVEQIAVALPEGSASRARAEGDGFRVTSVEETAGWADVVALLAPDEAQAEIYAASLHEHLREGAALVFAHGLNVHFGLIEPRADLDILLVAPKGPGSALRADYVAGKGMITLIGVGQDASGAARDIAVSYAAGLGSGRAGIIESSFQEETEADLFNEQGVLWGVIPDLIEAGYETLVDAGFAPEIAYFECLSEVKLLADLLYERGIAGMREAISNTAEFGAMLGHNRIVTDETRAEMRRILAEVQDGTVVRQLLEDARTGYPRLKASRDRARSHPIEATGRKIRALQRDPPQSGGVSE